MSLTPREWDVLLCLVNGDLNKQIAYKTGLSIPTVKKHLGNIYAALGARNGRQVLATLFKSAAGADVVPLVANATEADVLEILSDVVERIHADQENAANYYSSRRLDIDDLRRDRGVRADPLAKFIHYYDSLGQAPGRDDFAPETLHRFGGDIEPYHMILDVDLRSKDNDFSKFRLVRGGGRQPAVREKRARDVLIANHPCKPLAAELASRLGLAALAEQLCYQRSTLASRHFSGRYRSITAPLFDRDAVCTEAIVVVDIEPGRQHNQTSFGSPAPGR